MKDREGGIHRINIYEGWRREDTHNSYAGWGKGGMHYNSYRRRGKRGMSYNSYEKGGRGVCTITAMKKGVLTITAMKKGEGGYAL